MHFQKGNKDENSLPQDIYFKTDVLQHPKKIKTNNIYWNIDKHLNINRFQRFTR